MLRGKLAAKIDLKQDSNFHVDDLYNLKKAACTFDPIFV